MKDDSQHSIAALEAEYRALAAIGQGLAEELSRQLAKLLQDADVPLAVPIQQRVKSWRSLAEKFERGVAELNSVKDVQDLVGLRIIVLFRRDIERASDLIRQHLAVIRSYDTGERLKEDQFGYSSVHFVVCLPETWLSLPSLAGTRGLIAEIQLRTLAQHMWAEASHFLQYKREDSVPNAIRRSLSRSSAMLETLDLEFDRVLTQREEYRNEIDLSGPDENLNVDVLEKCLDALLPPDNKDDDEDYAELLAELKLLSVSSIDKLRTLVSKRLNEILQEDRARVRDEQARLSAGLDVVGTESSRIVRGVYFTHVGLTRTAVRREFGHDWREKLKGTL